MTVLSAPVRSDEPDAFGDLATAPASGSVTLEVIRADYPFFSFAFHLNAAQIPVTDATSSGSYGSLNLWTCHTGYLHVLGCTQEYTAFAEGAALTGAAGDASFDIGIGSVEIAAAADGALATTSDNIGDEVNVTLSGGTATAVGLVVGGTAGTAIDGTGTACKIALNWSGTAATIDADSTIDVSGIVTVSGVFIHED